MEKNSKFERWTEERKKGMLNYVAKSTLYLGILLIIGRIIGYLVSGNAQFNGDFFAELSLNIAVIVIVSGFINSVIWYVKEFKYRNSL
ncbi:hypothetical protein A1QO_18985 [Vibrio genomosp. F10 str. ZF-129]|uniref:Uncharacterized protein n=1 Tax=Vibrio genomosp. F10 str. ZF-129 TaxID=1187848 RepID=A0A1E5BHI6_9VIBR|nr:hypothetical protein [Vibrio genomosp. F10]OEE36503.1 hypothetical protein A1QO_18985 [Vibrio genomosp. F10 str. ZF-129]